MHFAAYSLVVAVLFAILFRYKHVRDDRAHLATSQTT